MLRVFNHVLCAGFLISLVSAGAARSIVRRYANDNVAQNADLKTQTPPSASTWVLTGKIDGEYALSMELHRKDGQISGRYRYVNNPKAGYLALQGTIDKSGSAEISEFDISDKKKKTGTFKGAFAGDIIGHNSPTTFVGFWTKAKTSVNLVFSLSVQDGVGMESVASTASEDRVDIKGKIYILRQDPELPIPELPSLGDDCCYYKQPLITGKQPAQVLRKIREALDPETVLHETVESSREDLYFKEFKDEQGNPSPTLLNVSIDYEEGYNANYILSFTYLMFDDRGGKYRTFHFPIVIDLKTGNVVTAEDVFRPDMMEALRQAVAQRFQKELKARVDKVKSDYPDAEEYYETFKQMIAENASLDGFTVDA
jgi:hypothetical protein